MSLPLRTSLLRYLREMEDPTCEIGTAELVMCADLLFEAADADAARLLYNTAFLQGGFSPDCIQAQARIALRTKLWGDVPWAELQAGDEGRAAKSQDDYWGQLNELVNLVPGKNDLFALDAGAAFQSHAAYAKALSMLCSALRQPASIGVLREVETSLVGLHSDVESGPIAGAADHAGDTAALLAHWLSTSVLRRFTVRRLPLMLPPTGSPALFHAAAHLHGAGLEPYFDPASGRAKFGDEIRGDEIRLFLYRDGDESHVVRSRRGFLLALVLNGTSLITLVDELARAEMVDPIRFILARAMSRIASRADSTLLEHVRDAGLTISDFDLARRAQRLVLDCHTEDGGAWLVLGDIEAVAGNRPGAEVAYVRSRSLQAGATAAADRLDSLHYGRYGLFENALASAATQAVLPRWPGTFLAQRAADDVLRKQLLRLALNPSVLIDQVDCAEIAFSAGHTDAARILYDVIFIVSGFSTAALQRQQETEQRLGLWEAPKSTGARSAAAARLASGSALAVEQLTMIMSDAGRTLQPMPAPNTHVLSGSLAAPPNVPSCSELHAFCARLRHSLRQHPSAQALADLRRELLWLEQNVISRSAIDATSYCQLNIADLAFSIAFNLLRHFAITIHQLARGPLGSVEVLHASARLEESGLGPYFGRTADQFSSPRDLFGLIQLCTRGASTVERWRDALERWSVLLSGGYRADGLSDFIDALADLGLMRALRGIASRIAAQSNAPSDCGLLWKIRDAALDNADLDLAAQVQRRVTDLRSDDPVEWVVLGEIDATAGKKEAATTAFEVALRLKPNQRGARERLEALEENRFGQFRVLGGFGTAPERTLLRQSRLRATKEQANFVK